MFSCHYDGCESETDTSSSESEPDPVECALSRYKAKNFEELMNCELDSTVTCFNFPKIRDKDNRHVRFGNTSDDEQKEPSCDDLFYDETEDELNAQWISEHLPGNSGKPSDAVLNCPCCMTVLTVSCRRHAKFRTKYSSKFPVHCIVDEACALSNPKPAQAKRRKCDFTAMKSQTIANCLISNPIKQYAVKCGVCGIVVGTKQDKSDEVQFSHVLASHA
ncbi:hypothetical protein D915_006500 [Fasciola hepatica]|uniref:E2F-associated phosphoprotein n=1 Tax=Fasciola hepatica TaxID=6192 RepID=A0A2H1C813_FASHE|nr:hypothetical protein D915_006500 [Fasciola hepatica]